MTAHPRSPLRLLLRLEARRMSDALRQPRPAAWIGILLPVALAAGGLWVAGDAMRPDVSTADGAIGLGMLVAAPVALQAYPILFRAVDDAFLRRLGIPARALFGVRAMRLLALALAVVFALMIPVVSTRQPILPPLAIALAAAVVAWAASLLAQASAAGKLARGDRPSPAAGLIGWDPELAKAAALVYAPLWPLLAGAAAARVAVAPVGAAWMRIGALTLVSAALLPWATRAFARALPRFAPHAGELAYAPPPDASGGELVVGRGIARVLPRRAQSVRARDAVVIGRRYRWASRAAWPASIVSALVLLRAGGHGEVRAWVTLACGLLLAAQAAAVVALGRSERGRLRWMDRALGLRPADRVVGRWAASFGLALAVALPLALGWAIAIGGSGGWMWLGAAAAVALVASTASVAAAGR
ncbi:hypothetical protein [Longimicrobium sp.]|uniref:hypothetical protein n=1 Tax=Longimicrobium sp. TaxID=2029185 RepID=UPI002BE60766|nr:hypothetical protein [Longimicrobium sp.]HSU15231.1 hypothetical protein [Longimicrobium sp.]